MDKPLKIKFGNIVFKIISIFFPVKKRVFFIGSFKDKLIMKSLINNMNQCVFERGYPTIEGLLKDFRP